MIGEPKDGVVNIDYSITYREYTGLDTIEYDDHTTIGMPTLEERGMKTTSLFGLNKWCNVGGTSKDNKMYHILIRVLTPDASGIDSLIPEQIVRH